MTESRLYRLWQAAGLAACAGAMAFALYLQSVQGLEPCPMCIFQRVAMIACGLFFALGLVHGPQAWGRWVYAGGASLAALGGGGIAARHVWLQSLPPDQVPSCGPSLDYLMDIMPLAEVITTILRGDGNCAIIDWQFLGLSLPGWTLVGFAMLLAWALAGPFIGRRQPA